MVWMCFEQKSRNCTVHIPAKIKNLVFWGNFLKISQILCKVSCIQTALLMSCPCLLPPAGHVDLYMRLYASLYRLSIKDFGQQCVTINNTTINRNAYNLKNKIKTLQISNVYLNVESPMIKNQHVTIWCDKSNRKTLFVFTKSFLKPKIYI